MWLKAKSSYFEEPTIYRLYHLFLLYHIFENFKYIYNHLSLNHTPCNRPRDKKYIRSKGQNIAPIRFLFAEGKSSLFKCFWPRLGSSELLVFIPFIDRIRGNMIFYTF